MHWEMNRRYQETESIPPPDAFKNMDIISAISYERTQAALDNLSKDGGVIEIGFKELLVSNAHVPDLVQIIGATREIEIDMQREKTVEIVGAAIVNSIRNIELVEIAIDKRVFSGLDAVRDAPWLRREELREGFTIVSPTTCNEGEKPRLVSGEPAPEQAPENKLVMEVVEELQLQKEPRQEAADWGIVVDLPLSYPLDLYID